MHYCLHVVEGISLLFVLKSFVDCTISWVFFFWAEFWLVLLVIAITLGVNSDKLDEQRSLWEINNKAIANIFQGFNSKRTVPMFITGFVLPQRTTLSFVQLLHLHIYAWNWKCGTSYWKLNAEACNLISKARVPNGKKKPS